MWSYGYTFKVPEMLGLPPELQPTQGNEVVFTSSVELTPEQKSALDAFMIGKGYDPE